MFIIWSKPEYLSNMDFGPKKLLKLDKISHIVIVIYNLRVPSNETYGVSVHFFSSGVHSKVNSNIFLWNVDDDC